MRARPTIWSCSPAAWSGTSKGWWVTTIFVMPSGRPQSFSRTRATWAWLMRPPLNTNERAVFTPTTAISPSMKWGSRSSLTMSR
jgi:hypothetical protein